jgi:two-component system sensor histidine kinase RpfC
LRVEVIDTGIGIARAKQETIFEAFSQADESITRIYGGTGLGTTIAKQLVSLMGGTIGLESTVGAGSNFWFELPLEHAQPVGIDLTVGQGDSPAMSFAAKARSTPASVHRIRGARILVAEDNSTNQRVAQLILESGGHHITIVKNGEEALDALETSHFDLALFDLSMPLVSGLEALKLYRFSTPRPVPVLILSAHVTPETILECERAGASEFISKPLRASILLDAIERHLAGMGTGFGPQPTIPRADERPPLTVVETPTLDESVLLDLQRLSPDSTFVERLIDGFLADAERLTAEIVDALAQRKWELVKDVAHALKGGAASVGAMSLAQLATRLNNASHDTLRLKATAWSEEVLRTSAVTQDALKAYATAHRAANARTSKPSSS